MKIIELQGLNSVFIKASANQSNSAVAYKLFKIKKALNEAFKEYVEEEKGILKEAELSESDINEKGQFKEGTDEDKLKRFIELKTIAQSKELEVKFEKLTFEEFHAIAKENNFNNGLDIALEGVVWEDKKDDNIPTA